MGFESIRGSNNKCPPFLLCGLMIMCFFLLCNWWSLSSQHFELLKQIDNLAEQLRVNGEDLGKCSQQRVLLDEKLKNSQNKFVQQQVKIEQIRETEDEVKKGYQKILAELNESKKKSETVEKNLELCFAEKNSLKELSDAQEQNIQKLQYETNAKRKIKNLEKIINSSKNNTNFLKLKKEEIKKLIHKPDKSNNDQERLNSLEEKEEAKNEGEPSIIPIENDDPRELAMKVT